jgi:integrase
LVTFAYSTGWLWKSEVAYLAWTQVDLNEGRVELAKGTMKNGEGRRIYLTPEIRAVLEQQWSEHLAHFRGCEFAFIAAEGESRTFEPRGDPRGDGHGRPRDAAVF